MEKEKLSKIMLEEVEILKKEWIIDSDTLKKISDYYSSNIYTWTKSSGFIQTILIIGIVLIGLWVILFFASNWDKIQDLYKTLLLIFVLVVTYFLWYRFYYVKQDYPKTGYSLITLWSIFFWACIILLWQIYNVWWEFYQAMLVWFFWVVPLAYLTWFSGVFVVGLISFFAFLFWYFDEISLYENFYFFILAYVWGLFVALSRLHSFEKYLNFEKILNILWVFILFLTTFILTFDIGHYSRIFDTDTKVFSIISWIILAVTIFILIYYYLRAKTVSIKHNIGYAVHMIIMIVLGFIYMKWYFDNQYVMVAMNIYFMIMILYVLYLGTLQQRWYLVNVSLLFFIVYMIAKYFDWFYDMFDRSLFFIWWWVLLLLGWMFLERRRRLIISSFKN